MVIYDPIFGIHFYLPITSAVERIYERKTEPGYSGDLLDLDSDAEHQSEKSEHPA